jgi:FdhD protein
MSEGSVHRAARRLTAAGGETLDEIVKGEVAVALVCYNGVSHDDGHTFAISRISRAASRRPSVLSRSRRRSSDVEVEPVERGIEVRLRIAAQRMVGLQERRRTLAGRNGLQGLCGVDSSDEAMRPGGDLDYHRDRGASSH